MDGWLRLCLGPKKLKLAHLKYELRSMEAKAAKDEKHVANAQLVVEQKHVMVMLGKKVKTQRNEFLLKIISMNSESAEATGGVI